MSTLQGSLKANKKVLRQAVSSSLGIISSSAIQTQSQAITKTVLSLPAFHRCESVSCYLNMPTGEVDTSLLVTEILHAGKTLFVPKIDQAAAGKMDFLKIYDEVDLNSLPRGVWGIREPEYQWQGQKRLNALDPECDKLDMILLPGVAFDRSRSRLGHGKGYYDRFISSYASSGRRPLLVGLALEEQILDHGKIPIGASDWKMDLILGPDEIIGENIS